jgi:hypothetical protein
VESFDRCDLIFISSCPSTLVKYIHTKYFKAKSNGKLKYTQPCGLYSHSRLPQSLSGDKPVPPVVIDLCQHFDHFSGILAGPDTTCF